MFSTQRWIPTLLPLCFVGWALLHFDIYFSEAFRLPRDNYEVAFPLFRYVIEYLRKFYWVPTWVYGHDGGVWIEPLVNNYLLFVPYRFIGYLLGGLGILSPAVAYKFAFLWVGIPVFFYGIYRLSLRLGFSIAESSLIVVVGFLSSLGLGPLHQEQFFATIFFVPFLWLLLLNMRGNRSRLYLFACLTALSLHNHYPQILLLYFIAVALAVIACGKPFLALMGQWCTAWFNVKGLSVVGLSMAAFIVVASPLFYSYAHFKDKLRAPDRGMATLGTQDPKQYKEMNLQSHTSLAPESLALYVGAPYRTEFRLGDLDENSLYVTPAVLLMLLLLFVIRVPGRRFHLLILMFLTVLSLGVYAIAPFLLWLPGVSLFRQWYHFTSLLGLHLLFAIAYALKAFWNLRPTKVEEKRLMIAGALLVISGIFFRLNPYFVFPAALLIAIRVLRPDGRHNRLLAFGIVGWLVVGGISWGRTATHKVATYTQWVKYIDVSPSKFFRPHVGDEGEWKTLAVPVGNSEARSIKQLAMKAPFYWVSVNGSLGGVRDSSLQLKPVWNGYQVSLREKPPKQGRGLLFAQWAETRWRITNEKGNVVSYRTGPFGLVEIPLGSGTSWTIRHPASAWHSLIFLMWLPLILYGYFARREMPLLRRRLPVQLARD